MKTYILKTVSGRRLVVTGGKGADAQREVEAGQRDINLWAGRPEPGTFRGSSPDKFPGRPEEQVTDADGNNVGPAVVIPGEPVEAVAPLGVML
jgi:hypothetical protein